VRATGPGPLRLLMGSFVLLIGAGTALLKLPAATPAGQPISWIDALFTATSAACVTGLAVRDTGTGFTLFGQWVILGLIQLGGLGVMTLSLFVLALFRGRVSQAQRSVLEQTVTGRAGRHLAPVLRLVLLFALGIEAVGALVLFLCWLPEMAPGTAAYYAVFHAVSAFCNAGFGLRPDSLVAWRGHPGVILTVSALIVLGGLGFFTVYDVLRSARTRGRLSVQSRLALAMSAFLLVAGTVLFWALESGRLLRGMGVGEQALAALFQSVTVRTAGFNSVDIAGLAPATLFLMVLLMFVGGSPGSCAGGIKTTTAGVLAAATLARLRGLHRVNLFYRTLGSETVRNSLTITLVGIFTVVVGLFALILIEAPGGTVEEERAVFIGYLFETVSALGTVGLTTGATPLLTPGSRLLVALLMFAGRLGPLTVAVALAGERRGRADWQYPEEEVMVG
jgi:trk system potassium uptake protein TrkH